MAFVGIDLAWGDRARTGVAVLDATGRLVRSASVRTDDEIAELLGQDASSVLVAAIDAPLVVTNDAGRRPCEAEVGRLFGGYGAGAYPSNRGRPHFVPAPRGARLAARFGWDMDPAVRPSPGRPVCIEVYPHPAMVSLFDLDSVIPYKGKPGRGVAFRVSAFQALLRHIDDVCGSVLGLVSSARWGQIHSAVAEATRQVDLEVLEDEIDAIFCGYLGWLWATHPQQLVVLGTLAAGYIVTPLPPTTQPRPGTSHAQEQTGCSPS